VITISGFTCKSLGNPSIDVGKTISWDAAATDEPAVRFHMPTDCGISQSALKVARFLPEANGAGYVSTPSPMVICTGVPPLVGTAQMWRRSMSLALVQ